MMLESHESQSSSPIVIMQDAVPRDEIQTSTTPLIDE